MALTSLSIKKDLSGRELSRLLNQSGLTKQDCQNLRQITLKNDSSALSLSVSAPVVDSALLPCLRINNSNGGSSVASALASAPSVRHGWGMSPVQCFAFCVPSQFASHPSSFSGFPFAPGLRG